MQRLRWKQIRMRPNHCCHVNFKGFSDRSPTALHSHDFSELFWFESGAAWHEVNGKQQELERGSLVLMRPDDGHAIKQKRGCATSMFNLAFPAETVDRIRKQYFADVPDFWGGDAELPQVWMLTTAQMSWLRAMAQELAAKPESLLALDRFLLNLFYELGASHAEDSFHNAPEWLARACQAMRLPEHFHNGPREFAALTGRSYEHVSRVLKQSTGLTPGEVTTRFRLEHAAGLLVTTDTPVIEICLACGYESLSFFYSIFRKQYGMPPRRYRQEHKKVILLR